jgi:hypothetical protein
MGGDRISGRATIYRNVWSAASFVKTEIFDWILNPYVRPIWRYAMRWRQSLEKEEILKNKKQE